MSDSVDLSRFMLFSFVSRSFFFASGFSFLFNGVFWGVDFSLRVLEHRAHQARTADLCTPQDTHTCT